MISYWVFENYLFEKGQYRGSDLTHACAEKEKPPTVPLQPFNTLEKGAQFLSEYNYLNCKFLRMNTSNTTIILSFHRNSLVGYT